MSHQISHSEILHSAHNVFTRILWISEQTAIISPYSIKLIGFYNRGRDCSLRGTEWAFKCDRSSTSL